MASSPEHEPDPAFKLILSIDVFVGAERRSRRSFVEPERLTIGRSSQSDILFTPEESTVSSNHAEIVRTHSGFLLRDTDSRNGLYLPGGSERIRELPLGVSESYADLTLGPGGPLCRVTVGCMVPFAGYLITGQLGEGGMATVFSARKATGPERTLVLKLIAQSLLLSIDPGEAKAMFEEEARIASHVCHSNVVNIFDTGCCDGTHYIAMEYLRGVNLSTIQRQLGRLNERCPFPLAAALVSQACFGLHAAHEARDATGKPLGIVHRDFTPSNIVCTPDGDVKLIDFGVARALGRRSPLSRGQFVGKPAYASPEQITRPQEIDRRSDVFSAGVILYELCAGRTLFQRENDFASMDEVLSAPIPPIAEAPPALNQILSRALSREPERRHSTAAELAEDLERFALSLGGEHLQRRTVAQALGRLGVDLEPALPRALTGRPLLLPPGATEPPRSRLSEAPQPPPQPVPAPRLPAEIVLAGEPLRLVRPRPQPSAAPDASYVHACFDIAPGSGSGAEPGRRVLHLIGGASLLSAPDATMVSRLRDLVDRWQLLPTDAFVPLLFAGEAWPDGPFALLLGDSVPELLWQQRGASIAADASSRVALLHALAATLETVQAALPGFVHGALAPDRIALIDGPHGLQPQLLFGGSLAWLLGGLQAPSPPSPYREPQLQQGMPASPASDVFAVGAIGYELLGGDLQAADVALRSGARVPPLPPSISVPDEVRSVITEAMHPQPHLRPIPSELVRCLRQGRHPERDPLMTLPIPRRDTAQEAALPGGRRVVFNVRSLDRSLPRAPLAIPFDRVPHLLPVKIGISVFRNQVAVEILDRPDSDRQDSHSPAAGRARLYGEGAISGDERLLLLATASAFEVGSRSLRRLQRIEFLRTRLRPEIAFELPQLGLRFLPEEYGPAVLLWTKERRSGDIHCVCVQITE